MADLSQHVRMTYSDKPFTCSCDPHVRDGSRSYLDHLRRDVLSQPNVDTMGDIRDRLEEMIAAGAHPGAIDWVLHHHIEWPEPEGHVSGNCHGGNMASRLNLAKKALVDSHYFRSGQVGDDIAPRITELVSFFRSALEQAQNETVLAKAAAEGAASMMLDVQAEYIALNQRLERETARADDNYRKLTEARVANDRRSK